MTSSTRPGRQGGFTLIELLIAVAVIGVLGAIAIPALLRARISGNEANAIGALRGINSAQAGYSSAAGGGGYATSLVTLATPCPGSTAPFISSDLSTDPSAKSGYLVSIQAAAGSSVVRTDCHGTETRTNYYSTAVPLAGGISGYRGFASGSGGSVFFDPSGAAPTEAAMAAGNNLIQ